MGEEDLSVEKQEYLQKMTTDVETVDIRNFFDDGYIQLQGWSIKAFAILASKFEKTMLIDSDVFFLGVRNACACVFCQGKNKGKVYKLINWNRIRKSCLQIQDTYPLAHCSSMTELSLEIGPRVRTGCDI